MVVANKNCEAILASAPAKSVRFFTVPKKKKGDFDGGFKIIS